MRVICPNPRQRIAMNYDRLERGMIDANTGRPAQSELGILVAVITGSFLHEHHDPAPHGGIINSHERSDQP